MFERSQLDPFQVEGHVGVDARQLWLGTVDAPADDAGHEPTLVLVVAQERAATVALASILLALLVASAHHGGGNVLEWLQLLGVPLGTLLVGHDGHFHLVNGRLVVRVVIVDLLAPANHIALGACAKGKRCNSICFPISSFSTRTC